MTRTIMLACSILLCAATARAGDVAPDNPGEGSTRAFKVDLGPLASVADVIPAIVEAGRAQLSTACEATPGATVRIVNPLASGDFTDVSCADILATPAALTGQTSEALSNEPGRERIGQAQQGLGAISLVACGLFAAGSFLFLNEVLCPAAKTPSARTDCSHVANFGGAGITILCAIPF